MDLGTFLTSVFTSPAVVLPIAIFALISLFRKMWTIWKPHHEASKVYKTILSVLPYLLGPGLAFAIKGVGFIGEFTWAYLVLVGMVSGFLNDLIWRVFKGVLKKTFKLTDSDIDKAIEVRNSKLPTK